MSFCFQYYNRSRYWPILIEQKKEILDTVLGTRKHLANRGDTPNAEREMKAIRLGLTKSALRKYWNCLIYHGKFVCSTSLY